MRRLITLALLSSLAVSYTLPVMAIQDAVPKESAQQAQTVKIKKEKKKETKVTPSQNKYEYINMEWWKSFNDPILEGYIIRALENNKDLKIASLSVDEFYQSVLAQRANEMPSVYTGFLPAYAKTGRNTNFTFALPLIMSYEIDLWGKNHNKTTAVRKMYETTILDEQSAYISVAAAVGSAYINIVKLDSMIDMQENIVNLRKDIFEIMDISNKEGIVSTSDLVKANQSYMLGVTELTDLKKARTKLLHALAVLVGDSPNNIEEYSRISYKDLTYSGDLPVTVSSDVIMNRPDYLKAEKMLEKAGLDVRIARKEMCPSITLGGGAFFNNKEIGSLFNTSSMLWGVGGGLIQPAFMGGKLRANLKAKKIAYEKAVKNYEKVNLTSMQEVNDTLVSVNMDREKLSKQQEVQRLEMRDFTLTQEKYKEGIISQLDLKQKQENLLNVNRMVSASNFDCMIDYISYYKAIAAAKNVM
ncbi:MAG: efflux transporter outer membrane subunit [bacterium]|nr:efflux transporter outer membrane subunit [bacterium]